MTWVDLSGVFGYGTVLTSTQMQNLRDNVVALKDGEEQMCRYEIGSYTGDGSTSLQISNISFDPKALFLYAITSDGNPSSFIKTSDMTSGCCIRISAGDLVPGYIIDIGSNGFIVSDFGADAHPNKNGQGYGFIAYG